MYSIVYRLYGLPEINLDFPTETALWNYVNTWITADVDYIAYFHNGIEYDPPWTR
jgi:hypothetical protein